MSAIAGLFAISAALLLAAQLRRLRGTTLRPPCVWAIVALIALGALELATWQSAGANWLPHARFVAAGLTLCPFMALLGAKRPQDWAWQFVVLSLWGLFVFYGLTELAYRPHQPPQLHWVVRWLLIVPLIVMGAVNYLPTHYAGAALLAVAGQALLFAPQFPEVHSWLPGRLGDDGSNLALAGSGLLSSAAVLGWATQRAATAWLGLRSKVIGDSPSLTLRPSVDNDVAGASCPCSPTPSLARRASADSDSPSLTLRATMDGPWLRATMDGPWREFWNQFGTFWGLRIAARFNQTAEELGWEVRLTRRGLEAAGPADETDNLNPATVAAASQAMRSLLRRFVDEAWLARRANDQGW